MKILQNAGGKSKEAQDYKKLKEYFDVISGKNSTVCWKELKSIMDKKYSALNKNEEFSEDSCRSLVGLGDFDKSGELGLEEFRILWGDIAIWAGAFKLYDKDNSGDLDQSELQNALKSGGFQVTRQMLGDIQKRYGDGKKNTITLENFLQVACKLKILQLGVTTGEKNEYPHSYISFFIRN